MNACRIIENAGVRDDWRLIRITPPSDRLVAPGQWYRLSAGRNTTGILPVYRHHAEERWVAGLVPGNTPLAALAAGTALRADGPFGALPTAGSDQAAVLIGIGPSVGPALACAEALAPAPRLVVLDGSDGVPARLCPSQFVVGGLPEEAIAGVATLEAAGVVARIADPRGRPGCFEGDAVSLLRRYAAAMDARQLADTPLLAFTPWRRLAPWQEELTHLFATLEVCDYPDF